MRRPGHHQPQEDPLQQPGVLDALRRSFLHTVGVVTHLGVVKPRDIRGELAGPVGD